MVREGASMVLEIPGKILGQEDVRETPASAGAFSFDTNDFTDTAGLISLKNKTSYLSIPSSGFATQEPDVNNVFINSREARADANTIPFYAAVNLPHGAVVTAIIVYGNAGATSKTYTLHQTNRVGNFDATMATANIGTEDSTITSPTIDNDNFSYSVSTTSLNINDRIYGARITYTTDYD